MDLSNAFQAILPTGDMFPVNAAVSAERSALLMNNREQPHRRYRQQPQDSSTITMAVAQRGVPHKPSTAPPPSATSKRYELSTPVNEEGLEPFDGIHINSALNELFDDGAAASWLLSKRNAPPLQLSASMLQTSVFSNHYFSMEREPVAGTFFNVDKCFEHEDERRSWHSNSDTLTELYEPKAPAVRKNETTYVGHFSTPTTAYLTIVDSSSPFLYLGKENEVVRDLRKTVVKLLPDGELILYSHFWCTSGRSVLGIYRFPPHAKSMPSGAVCLFAPYPSNRYPQRTDLLQMIRMNETRDCDMCLLRSSDACQCSNAMLARHFQTIPAETRKDAFQAFTYYWIKRMIMLRKIQIRTYDSTGKRIQDGRLYTFFNSCRTAVSNRWRGCEQYLAILSDSSKPNPVAISCGNNEVQESESDEEEVGVSNGMMIEELGDIDDGIVLVSPDVAPDLQEKRQGERKEQQPQEQEGRIRAPACTELPPKKKRRTKRQSGASGPPKSSDGEEASVIGAAEAAVLATEEPATGSHMCPHCPATFSRKYEIDRHIRTTHQNQRNYQCDQCGKTFFFEWHRKAHVATVHDGEKPFACTLCPKRFGTKSNWRKHLKALHKVEV